MDSGWWGRLFVGENRGFVLAIRLAFELRCLQDRTDISLRCIILSVNPLGLWELG